MGLVTPAWRFIPETVEGYEANDLDFALVPMLQRRERATQLLLDAGYGPHNPLDITYSAISQASNKRLAVVLRSMWQNVGVKVTLDFREMRVHFANMDKKTFELGYSSWNGGEEPYDYLAMLTSLTGEINYNSGDYQNDTFDSLVKEALQISGIQPRYAKFAEAEELMLSEVGIIPLYFGSAGNLVKGTVQGYADNVFNVHPSEYMWFGDRQGVITATAPPPN